MLSFLLHSTCSHIFLLQIESCQLESLQRRTTETIFLSSKLARSRLRHETIQVSTTSKDNRFVILILHLMDGYPYSRYLVPQTVVSFPDPNSCIACEELVSKHKPISLQFLSSIHVVSCQHAFLICT